jgi:ferric-dicitrate binding protein FerR (iron transport regulator)
MSATEHSRFDDLVSRYLDDALTTSDAAELVALLAEPSLAARFLETTRLNSEIAGLLAAPVPDAAMAELVRTDIERSLGDRSSGRTRLHIVERAQTIAATPVVSAPRRMPASRPLAWAAVLLAFAGLAAVILFNRGPVADVPVVASVQGEVRLVRAGGERAVMVGDSWQRDEELKTSGPGAAATLTFRDGTHLVFGGDTVAVNASSKDGLRVQLDHGTVQAALKTQAAQRPFVFATPEAEAIVTGTKLRLITGGHHTRLEVTEGEVRFRRLHDGAEVTVKAGHYAVVAPNAPFVAMPFHPDPHAVH